MTQEVLERVKAAEACADERISAAKTEADAILKSAKQKAEDLVKNVSLQHVKIRSDARLEAENEAELASGPILAEAKQQSEGIQKELQERVEAAARWVAERIVR